MTALSLTQQAALEDAVTAARAALSASVAEQNRRHAGIFPHPWCPKHQVVRDAYDAALDELFAFLDREYGAPEPGVKDMPFLTGTGPVAGWTLGD